MNYQNSLENLGLVEKEAKIYLSLLQLGRASAYLLSKHSGIKKSTCYVVLESLINKGFARKHRKTTVLEYMPVDPEIVFDNVNQRVVDTKTDMIELQSLFREEQHQTQVTWFDGIDGIKEMHQELFKAMKNKSYISFYSHIDNIPSEVLEFFDYEMEMLRKYNIRRRAITVDDPKLIEAFYAHGLHKYFKVHAKALPKDIYNSKISIDVYNNSVQIFSQRSIHGLIIKDKDIADFFRDIFEIIWEQKNWKKLYGREFEQNSLMRNGIKNS